MMARTGIMSRMLSILALSVSLSACSSSLFSPTGVDQECKYLGDCIEMIIDAKESLERW